jgi:DNA mismatch repair protein MLH3
MQTIKRLPKSVHSSLRSSVILSDLPRVIEELIYNSIDANASKVMLYMWRREEAMYNVFYAIHYHQRTFILFEFQIDIAVNIRACYVKVEDDGMYLYFSFFCKKSYRCLSLKNIIAIHRMNCRLWYYTR